MILPSMEAVRHVPQSMAVLQSTVTTGARWPPRLKQLSRTFSSPPSCKTGERRCQQALFTNTATLSTRLPQARGLPSQSEDVPRHTSTFPFPEDLSLIPWARKCLHCPNYDYSFVLGGRQSHMLEKTRECSLPPLTPCGPVPSAPTPNYTEVFSYMAYCSPALDHASATVLPVCFPRNASCGRAGCQSSPAAAGTVLPQRPLKT